MNTNGKSYSRTQYQQSFHTASGTKLPYATVASMPERSIIHRDSEGYVQTIEPGEINMMTAGRGIVHSERTGPEFRETGGIAFGFQTWLALPKDLEETDPGFQHIGANEVPKDEGDGVSMSLLAGTLNGHKSPTNVFSETLFADLILADGAQYKIDTAHIERAMYVVSGSVEIAGQEGSFCKDQLVVFQPHAEIIIKARGPLRAMLLGGEPFPEDRHIF
jgi:redox-sensitive bicupin YhaK (pirin superfamily)